MIHRPARTGAPPVSTPESTTGTAVPRIRATPETKSGIPEKGAALSGRIVSRTAVSGTANDFPPVLHNSKEMPVPLRPTPVFTCLVSAGGARFLTVWKWLELVSG
ncbi:hypothetical protein Kisp01_46420 [Kineosporia sp. NBRC 101677]|nr:hypothetical protein Kisp01_46420 [Kineosporia sp. NBRC 101677]